MQSLTKWETWRKLTTHREGEVRADRLENTGLENCSHSRESGQGKEQILLYREHH